MEGVVKKCLIKKQNEKEQYYNKVSYNSVEHKLEGMVFKSGGPIIIIGPPDLNNIRQKSIKIQEFYPESH